MTPALEFLILENSAPIPDISFESKWKASKYIGRTQDWNYVIFKKCDDFMNIYIRNGGFWKVFICIRLSHREKVQLEFLTPVLNQVEYV